MAQRNRPQIDNIIRRMRIAGWIIKATNTHSEYVNLLCFHGNNGYAIAPHYVCKFIVCIVIFYVITKNNTSNDTLYVIRLSHFIKRYNSILVIDQKYTAVINVCRLVNIRLNGPTKHSKLKH